MRYTENLGLAQAAENEYYDVENVTNINLEKIDAAVFVLLQYLDELNLKTGVMGITPDQGSSPNFYGDGVVEFEEGEYGDEPPVVIPIFFYSGGADGNTPVKSVYLQNNTSHSFTIRVLRSNSTTTSVHWIAVKRGVVTRLLASLATLLGGSNA